MQQFLLWATSCLIPPFLFTPHTCKSRPGMGDSCLAPTMPQLIPLLDRVNLLHCMSLSDTGEARRANAPHVLCRIRWEIKEMHSSTAVDALHPVWGLDACKKLRRYLRSTYWTQLTSQYSETSSCDSLSAPVLSTVLLASCSIPYSLLSSPPLFSQEFASPLWLRHDISNRLPADPPQPAVRWG